MLPDRRSFLIAGGVTVVGLNAQTANAQLADDEAKAFVADHVKKHFPDIVAASAAMRGELDVAYASYAAEAMRLAQTKGSRKK